MYKKIETIIREAGQMILDAHIEKNNIHQKTGPANFVTDYDVRIQRFLIDRLGTLAPGCGFFGEEETEGNKRSSEGKVFFIDPIDGTTNFMFDYHNSCVSVGLAEDGVMIAGWVFDPCKAVLAYHHEHPLSKKPKSPGTVLLDSFCEVTWDGSA